MKDLDHEIQATLHQFMTGDPPRIAEILHRDFVAFGVESGLYVRVSADEFLRFMNRMRSAPATSSEIFWTDVRSRLAAACLVQSGPTDVRTTFVTLLSVVSGWQILSATFSVDEPSSLTAARQGLLQ